MGECKECGRPIDGNTLCEECWVYVNGVVNCCGCGARARRCDLVWLTMPAFDIAGSLRAKRSGDYCEKCARSVCRYLNGIELTYEQREAFAGAIISQRWDGRWSTNAAWNQLLDSHRKDRKRRMELTQDTLNRGANGEKSWRPGKGAEFIGSTLLFCVTSIRRYTPFGATRPLAEVCGTFRCVGSEGKVGMSGVYCTDWLSAKALWSLGRVDKTPVSKNGVDTYTVSEQTWLYLEAVELNEKGYPLFLRLLGNTEEELYREVMARKGLTDPTAIRTFYLPAATSTESSPFG